MTRVLTGHFDGRVIVLDTPADLPRDQRLVIRVDSEEATAVRDHSAGTILRNIEAISDQDAEEMRRAIAEERERLEPDPDANFE